jgi:hypothetical protein
MDTRPTPTLAKLHITQEKFEYALAVYLYLQEKENRDYNPEITLAVKEFLARQSNKYSNAIKSIFTQEELAKFRIIPDDLFKAVAKTLKEIKIDFDSDEIKAVKEDNPEIEEEKVLAEKDAPAQIVPTSEDNDSSIAEVDEPETELEFPTAGEIYHETPRGKNEMSKIETAKDELVPGLENFTSNYKKDVTQGLMEVASHPADELLENKLQDDIDQNLVHILHILRSMSVEELRKTLKPLLTDGKKLKDVTLSDLEDLID